MAARTHCASSEIMTEVHFKQFQLVGQFYARIAFNAVSQVFGNKEPNRFEGNPDPDLAVTDVTRSSTALIYVEAGEVNEISHHEGLRVWSERDFRNLAVW